MKRLLLMTTCLLAVSGAQAQVAGAPLPSYQECTSLANSNPSAALVKADAWLKVDNGIPAQHCRAMALYGLKRFAEAADGLSAVRDGIGRDNTAMRSYVARQAAKAMQYANQPDRALAVLSSQINEMSNVRGDNAAVAKLTSELLLDRARLNAGYNKLNEATKDLDHAVSLTPINEDVLIERASVFEKLGDLALARSDAEIVLKLNGSSAPAKALLARLGASPTTVDVAATPVEQPEPVKRKPKQRSKPKVTTAATAAAVAPAAAPVLPASVAPAAVVPSPTAPASALPPLPAPATPALALPPIDPRAP